MITIIELLELDYEIKTELFNGATDFRLMDSESSPYLVNLHEGVAQIIWGQNSNKRNITFDNIDDFKKWHYKINKLS